MLSVMGWSSAHYTLTVIEYKKVLYYIFNQHLTFNIMSIFSSLRRYASGWSVKSTDSFSAEDIALVSRTEVVPSEYGMSVCFFFKAGGQSYMPVSRDSNVEIGQSVDLTKAKVLTLSQEGSADIQRIEVNE